MPVSTRVSFPGRRPVRWGVTALACALLVVQAEASAPFYQYSYPSADVVLDRKTGLHWEQNPATMPMQSQQSGFTYQQAAAYCAALGGSYRLPSVQELQTLVDVRAKPDGTNPVVAAIDATAFPNTQQAPYWTSTPYAPDPTHFTWTVDFTTGTTTEKQPANSSVYVRCVY